MEALLAPKLLSDRPIASPLKAPGGQHYAADWIIEKMLPHTTYVEPYLFSGAVLFRKSFHGIAEVVNDIDQSLIKFWRVLADAVDFYTFQRVIEATPFSEDLWKHSDTDHDHCPGDIEIAVDYFVRCRQSLEGGGEQFASLTKTRLRRGMQEQVSAWLGAVEGLPAVHARLKRVLVLNREAVGVIEKFDSPTATTYCDPPFFFEGDPFKGYYRHKMDRSQHESLLDTILACKGQVLISGVHSELYDRKLAGWTCHERTQKTSMSHAKTKSLKTACLWTNR